MTQIKVTEDTLFFPAVHAVVECAGELRYGNEDFLARYSRVKFVFPSLGCQSLDTQSLGALIYHTMNTSQIVLNRARAVTRKVDILGQLSDEHRTIAIERVFPGFDAGLDFLDVFRLSRFQVFPRDELPPGKKPWSSPLYPPQSVHVVAPGEDILHVVS